MRADVESSARGTVFVAFRQAAVEQWGADGLHTLADALPPETRAATLDRVVVSEGFYPERHTIAWFQVAHDVMARGDGAEFARFLDGMMDHGFGRVRRALLRLATPGFLLDQAGMLWRHDHSRGSVTSEVGRGFGRLMLRDHAYVEAPIARVALTEIFRYGVTLTGTTQVSATHELTAPGELTITLRWR